MANKFFTRFVPPPACGVDCSEGGLTDQHFKEECDLNNILRRYRATGIPPASDAVYLDTTSLPSSMDEAFDAVQTAVDWFDTLPSDVREKFGNDPRNALRLVQTDANAAIAAGLLPNLSKAVETAKPEPQKEAAERAPASEETAGE